MNAPANYPALGFDPAPGIVDRVQGMADNLATVAKELGEAHASLTSVGQADSIWEGQASRAFHSKVGELPGYLDKAHRSLGDAATVLRGWVDDLSSLQRTAVEYEVQAERALQTVETARGNPDLRLAGQQLGTDEALRDAQSRFDAAKSRLANAKGELEEIKQAAKRLFEQHQELADRVAEALRKAKDEAPEEPGFFDRIGEMLGDVVEGIKNLAGDVWNFVKEHADVIAKIGDVLSVIGNVLGVVAIATCWIPGVNAVTATAAAVVSGAAVGTKLLAKAAGADVSWTSIGLDALGALPGGRAIAGGKNAVTQTIRAGKGINKIPVAGVKALKIGEDTFTPITKAALRANPGEAMFQAAQFAHANGVKIANWVLPGSLKITDAFSTGGLIAGSVVNTGMKVGINQGVSYGEQKAKEAIGW